MVMTKPSVEAIRAADMGRREAEEVTKLIKDNFDSLGAMLIQARDRKAYRALGYRSFESYCQTEFGRSVSNAYQLIEDAKVISQLEARISENYGEQVTLNFPASHLKPLKEIADTDDKLRAIEYAKKLAEAENRKATKKDLEIAVFHVSGKRSEDFREAIQGLGFSRGVQVEVSKSLNQDRGFVTKIDKGGKVYVEFHYGGNAPIPYDAADLRILSEDEQPAKPLTDDITNKGDRVLIFSPALKGKEGTIFQWKSGKRALVTVDGQNSPVDIAYAEMQLLLKPEKKDSGWETDLNWNTANQTYYYFQKEDKIYSDKWPAGLTLTPSSHELSPIEFMANWEHKFAEQLLQLFPSGIPESPSALVEENQRLREQLAEAETTIQTMIAACVTSAPGDTAAHSDFLVESTSEISAPGDTAPHSDFLVEKTSEILAPRDFIHTEWKSILISNNFSPNYHYTDDYTEEYRGWKIYVDPNGGFGYVDLNHPKKGAFCCDINWLNRLNIEFKLENEDEIVKWAKGIVNQIEDFCPGQLPLFPGTEDTAAHSEFLVKNTSEISVPGDTAAQSEFLAENVAETSAPGEDNDAIISAKRERVTKILEQERHDLSRTNNEKRRTKIKNNIRYAEEQLKDLDKFKHFKVGDTIIKTRFPDKKGTLTKLEITPTGMPFAWVEWPHEYEEEPSRPEQHPLGVLTSLSIQNKE